MRLVDLKIRFAETASKGIKLPHKNNACTHGLALGGGSAQ
jgi:hypothetical protein